MKRLLIFGAVLGLCLGSVWADETVKAVQSRLKARGFYQGTPSGVYDSETSAAVTRYQIRNGLAISGKLDAPTLAALQVAPRADQATPEPSPQAGTWRRLRNGDMQFLKSLNSGAIPPPAPAPAPNEQRTSRSAPPEPTPRGGEEGDTSQERLRDYVGAFVLAGLDPQTGAELEFFADRVDYYGMPHLPRAKVRRDLVRYDLRWPDRRFWLAGDLIIDRRPGGEVRVSFPLRYELRNGHKHAAGEVLKTIVLEKSGRNDFKIIAVNERKQRRQHSSK